MTTTKERTHIKLTEDAIAHLFKGVTLRYLTPYSDVTIVPPNNGLFVSFDEWLNIRRLCAPSITPTNENDIIEFFNGIEKRQENMSDSP